MVRAIFSGSLIKPGAKNFTTLGMKISNKMVKIVRTIVSKDMAEEAKRIESFLPKLTNLDENKGTKAEVNAPSANKLLNKLGSLNDTKKASDMVPAPKTFAIIISRIKPVIRLIIVKPPNVAIDFIKDICFPYLITYIWYFILKSVNKGQINCVLS